MTDRKSMIRRYKEAPPPMGIYIIRNRANGKALLASSPNLPAIFNRHRFQLEEGVHFNRDLQKDWDEFGSQAFEFEILDTLEPMERSEEDLAAELRALEELWQEKHPRKEHDYTTKNLRSS